ncbi:MAG: ATP-binding protein [Geitlerinemataceae cyanobacterium]
MAAPALPAKRSIGRISFASTLYLCPVLDLLLTEVPEALHAELRLGLQEALVNAAKHGNKLDPGKTVAVEYAPDGDLYWWTISDQGSSTAKDCCCPPESENHLPEETSECGRGLFILKQIFDTVEWCPDDRKIRLGKNLKARATVV